jgi:uncharacterized membrane protein
MQHAPAMQKIRSRIVGANIPTAERIATGVAGAAAIVLGLRQRSIGGFVSAGLGTIALARAISGRCPAYRARAIRKGIHVRKVITIQATPASIYSVWRDLSKLPAFMSHIKEVVDEGNNISRWVVAVGKKHLEWRAQVVEDTPNRRLRWRSIGGDVSHEGEIDIREQAGDRGTVVEVKLHYFPPGGLVVASAFYGFLRKIVRLDLGTELVRLRQLLETGELATGARRRDLLDDDDKAVSASGVAPMQPRAATSAQTSQHELGGAR